MGAGSVSGELQVHLLGQFRVSVDGQPAPSPTTGRLQSLLAYLLLHADAPQSRAHLSFTFWPDASESNARNNLRQLLHQLRQAVPHPDRYLRTDASSVQWVPDSSFSLDVALFDAALAEAEAAGRVGDADASAGLPGASGGPLPGPAASQLLRRLDRAGAGTTRCCGARTRWRALVGLLEEQREYASAARPRPALAGARPPRRGGVPLAHAAPGARPATESARSRPIASASRSSAASWRWSRVSTTVRAYERIRDVEPESKAPSRGARGEPSRRHRWWVGNPSGRSCGRPGSAPSHGPAPLRAGDRRCRHRQVAAGGGAAHLGPAAGSRDREDALLRRGGPALLRSGERVAAQQRPLPAPRPSRGGLARRGGADPSRAASRGSEPPAARPADGVRRPLALLRGSGPGGARRSAASRCSSSTTCSGATARPSSGSTSSSRFDPAGSPARPRGRRARRSSTPQHPLLALLRDLRSASQLTEIALEPLDAAETAALAAQVGNRAFDTDAATRLYRETEGNPLFIVETVRAESGGGPAGTPSQEVPELPPRAHAVIAGRLAQLSNHAREIAAAAAVIGRAFDLEILVQLVGDEDVVARALDELWRKRIVREQGPNAYDFTHDKLREVAYGEISAPQRRRLHRRVAEVLVAAHEKDLDPVSAQIAAHYESAGLPEQAIPHYTRAAVVAQGVYAHDEAIALAGRGLSLLQQLPAERATRRRRARAPARPRPELPGDEGMGGPRAGQRCSTAPSPSATGWARALSGRRSSTECSRSTSSRGGSRSAR